MTDTHVLLNSEKNENLQGVYQSLNRDFGFAEPRLSYGGMPAKSIKETLV